jgi:hypothetical protein
MTTAAYGNDRGMLEDHGNRFVCVLYHRANRIIDARVDSNIVFDGLRIEGFTDRQLAKNELVQFLLGQRPRKIESDEGYRTVRLTQEGLDWANRECSRAPYTQLT